MISANSLRALCALFLMLLPSVAQAQAWWDAAWTRRQQITLGDAQIAASLTNFPVMVKLNSSRVTYSQFKAQGEDIRFFADAAGQTPLSYEIEKWNTSGDSIIWVMLPTLATGGSAGSFWMYWGNPAATDFQSAIAVWPTNTTPSLTAPDYQAVWHLQDTSESTNADAALTANGGATTTTGKIAGGYRLDAKNGDDVGDYLRMPTDLESGLGEGGLDVWLGEVPATLEFWINTNEGGGSDRNNSPAVTGVVAGASNGDGVRWGQVHARSGGVDNLCVAGNNKNCGDDDGPRAADGTWHHLVFTRDSATGNVGAYLDSVAHDFDPGAGTLLLKDMEGGVEGALFRDFGRVTHDQGATEVFLDADLDEIRIYNGVMGPDWVKGSYKAQADALITWCTSGTTWYPDVDGDSFGNGASPITSCSQLYGTVTIGTDCNDNNALINPTTLWYEDSDQDTYGSLTDPYVNNPSCPTPAGPTHWAPRAGDCDDGNALTWDTCGTCANADGDVAWKNCNAYTPEGQDCDDANNRTWNMCGTCADGDIDGYWDGCNAYPVRDGYPEGDGPDCDDANNRTWNMCGSCADTDTDLHWSGCNAYPPRQGFPLGDGPDLCETTTGDIIGHNNWGPGCTACGDDDGDGKYSSCDGYLSITQDFCDVDGQPVSENNWTVERCDPVTGCKDRDGDLRYSNCDIYGSIEQDFCDTDGDPVSENNWTEPHCNLTTGCKDRDGDLRYSNCDSYGSIDEDFCDVDGDPKSEHNWTEAKCDPVTGCKDRDGDTAWSVCDSYGPNFNQDFCDVDGQTVSENAWDSTACGGGCADGDGDGKWSGCNAYNTVTQDYCDVNDQLISENNWTQPACQGGCKDTDLDTFYVSCDAYITITLDCNDSNPNIHGGLWYRDFDADTYGNPAVTSPGCTQPGGYVANDDDCNDSSSAIKPGANETCGDGVDQNCDGVGGPLGDDDADGISYTQESGVGALDCDTDSDNDHVSDTIEWGTPLSGPARDTDGDLSADVVDPDDDGDGLFTEFESKDDLDGAPGCGFALDGLPSYIDVDSDGDGACDGSYTPIADECDAWASFDRDPGAGTLYFPDDLTLDYDHDGVFNVNDYDDFDNGACDADNDGLPSLIEIDMCYTPPGGIEVCLDPASSDTNGDGVDDGTEVGGDTDNPLDSDIDGEPDWFDLDDDGDLVPTLAEDYESPPDGDPTNEDTDGDEVPDYLDVDDDGDGVLTIDEDLDGDLDPTNDDSDGDLLPDYIDDDDQDGPLGDRDGDTVANGEEAAGGSDPDDPDSDGDGVLDGLEWADALGGRLDTDGDGTDDVLDDDDDGDGIPTAIEGSWDADSDGVGNYLDTDADDDGATDRAEGGDALEDGGTLPDTDEDGVPDFLDALTEDLGGGTVVPEPPNGDPGCACGAVTPPGAPTGALGLLALAALRRRRRPTS